MTASNMHIPTHDEALPAALAADVDSCFERLVLAYQDRLYTFALRLTASPQDAEEIAQDTFVRAYRALAGYPPERVRMLALRPWLYQIALNVFRNRVRGRQLQLVSLDKLDGTREREPEGDARERPDLVLEHAENERELSALVAALPERYRVAVILRHVEGFSYGELAALLNQPIGTVKANVHRGVQLLRESLIECTEEVS